MTNQLLLKLGLRLIALVGVIVVAIWISNEIKDLLSVEIMPHNEALVHKIVALSLLAYLILMAIPFVPGAEIGIGLLTAFGASIAPAVYVATLAGLGIAFIVGQMVPISTTSSVLRSLWLTKAADHLGSLSNLPREDIIDHVLKGLEPGLARFILRHRYLGLIVLINLPGNVFIGGGGGIALVAGLSRLFRPVGFFLAIAVGVLPVPLTFLLFG